MRTRTLIEYTGLQLKRINTLFDYVPDARPRHVLGNVFGGNLAGTCPFCQLGDKFRYDPVHDWFGCLKCDESGSLVDLMVKIRGDQKITPVEADLAIEMAKPKLSRERLNDWKIQALQARHPKLEFQSLTELMATEFEELPWVVEDLLPGEGITVLGGRPKIGKSFMALQLAQSVAAGAPFLRMGTSQGGVIYCALEDSPRRLKNRLEKQGARKDLPISICYRSPLDMDGLIALDNAIFAERPSLVIVDTLASFKSSKVDENVAGQMAEIMNGFRMMSQDYEAHVLCTAHHKKGAAEDVILDIRGSGAIGAAADTVIGVYRKEKKTRRAQFKAEGRDIDDLALVIQWDPETTWSWQLVGDASEVAASENEELILELLRDIGEDCITDIAKTLEIPYPTMSRLLINMAERDLLGFRWQKATQGKGRKKLYSLPESPKE